ncbi:MAG: hypothetical protein U5K00_15240 [Melioribacteraceae bacterium]|nr:hypothetical protein [Melioribacteraceae bacterium]
MKDTKLFKLTNRYIDNELGKNEKAELDELLKNPDNKKYFDSMVDTVNRIEESKPLEKEIDVVSPVAGQIKDHKNEGVMAKTESWFDKIFNGSKLSYATSFALGGLIVAFIFMLQPTNTEIDDAFLTGTIADRSFDKTYVLNEHDFEGAVNVKYADKVTILDVKLSTQAEIDCELSYDKTQFALYGVKTVDSQNSGQFASHGSSVRLSDLKSNHYLVFLRNLQNNESKVRASFYRGSMNISNITIDIKN